MSLKSTAGSMISKSDRAYMREKGVKYDCCCCCCKEITSQQPSSSPLVLSHVQYVYRQYQLPFPPTVPNPSTERIARPCVVCGTCRRDISLPCSHFPRPVPTYNAHHNRHPAGRHPAGYTVTSPDNYVTTNAMNVAVFQPPAPAPAPASTSTAASDSSATESESESS